LIKPFKMLEYLKATFIVQLHYNDICMSRKYKLQITYSFLNKLESP